MRKRKVMMEMWIRKLSFQLGILLTIEVSFMIYCLVGIYNNAGSEKLICEDKLGVMQPGNNGFFLPEDEKGKDVYTSVLTCVYRDIPAGTYSGTVYYHAEEDQHVSFSCSTPAYLEADTLILNRHDDTISFDITITHPVESLNLSFDYKGNGNFSAEVELVKSVLGYVRCAVLSLFIFSVIEILLIYFTKNPKKTKTVMILLVISFLASMPYMLFGMSNGHDYQYHILRIEGILSAIRDGQFPVYMQSIWMNGYGNPVSMYYGDILLFIPVFLRLIGCTVTFSYKAFVVLINIFTALISYYSFNRIYKDTRISQIATAAYVLAPYRMVDIYVRSAVGEYCAAMFLPLILSSFYCIMVHSEDSEEDRNNALLMTVGMTGLILTHIITVEMTLLFLACIAVVLFKRTCTFFCIKTLTVAAIDCIIINLFFLVPLVDSYINNDTDIKHEVDEKVMAIQASGVQLGEFFTFFKDIFGKASAEKRLNDRMMLSIGLTLTAAVIISLYLIFLKKASSRMVFFTILSFVSLWMSSDLFPWNKLSYYTKIWNIISEVRYSWRFLLFATLFAVVVLGELLIRYNKDKICLVVCGFIVFETLWFLSSYSSGAERSYVYNINSLDIGSTSTLEYLRYGTDITKLPYSIGSDGADTSLVERNGTDMVIYCETHTEDSVVTVPILNYKGYRVRDEKGKEYEIFDGENNEVSFTLPPGFAGNIIISFEPLWYWTLALWISIVWIVVIIVRRWVGMIRSRSRLDVYKNRS